MTQIINVRQAAVWEGELGQQWAADEWRYDAMLSGFNEALLKAAAIEARDQVLDVGCGTGQITRLAAAKARQGHAIGIDLSAAMLARARDGAEREEVRNVTFLQGDAQVYPFPPGAFDAAISRGGVMFFADPVAAFQHIGRALRASGRLAFIAPRPPVAESEAARVFLPLRAVPVAGEMDAEMDRAMFSLSDPERIAAVLQAAGWQEVEIAPLEAPEYWGSDAGDASNFALGMTRVRARLAGLDEATRECIRADVRRGFERYESADGVRLLGTAWLARAIRP